MFAEATEHTATFFLLLLVLPLLASTMTLLLLLLLHGLWVLYIWVPSKVKYLKVKKLTSEENMVFVNSK